MSTLSYEDVPKQRMGEALQAARTMIGLGEQEAADALRISVRKLRHWEAGRKAPGADMADAIGRVYGLDLGGNLPPRVPILFDVDAGGIVIADRIVAYIPGLTDNDDFLEGYVAVVRELRGLEPETPIQLRSSDIQVLATVLDLTDDDLENRLAFWMGQPPGSMIGVRHRLVLAAVVVGVLGGATAGAFMADASSAADADDGGPSISQTLDDDLGPDGGASFDLDLGTPSVDLHGSVVEMDFDGGSNGLELDFSSIEGDGFQGLDLDLDLDLSHLTVDDGAPAPDLDTPQPSPDVDAQQPAQPQNDTHDHTPAQPQADPVDHAAAQHETSTQSDPAPDVAPQPAADNGPAPAVDASPADGAEGLVSLGDASDTGATGMDGGDGELSNSPTVDDWIADGYIDESAEGLVDMPDLVQDDGPVDPPIPTEVAGPDASPDAPIVDDTVPVDTLDTTSPGAEVGSWDFDGTREWVRQNLDGGWVDGWQGDGVALTGSDLWEASTGDTSIDLNADGPGWFGRSVDTVEGETYEITFDMSGNPHGQRGMKSLNLTAGNDVAGFDFDTSTISRNDMQWETVTMTFTADADSTWVSFDSTTPGAVGAVIDNISITQVVG